MKKNTLKVLSVAAMAALFLAACGQTKNPGSSANENPESSVADVTTSEAVSTSKDVSSSETLPENYCKTIAEAIAIANEAGETGTTIEYRVSGTVKTVKNATYGEMTISDSTGELYIYGINNYSTMDPKPVAGDTVVLEGKLQVYKSTPEMGKANLISFEHKDSGGSSDVEIPADGVITTIAQAIEIAKSFGETYSTQKFTVTGVISAIADYKYGQMTIKDDTGSLSVYGVYSEDNGLFNTLDPVPAVGDTVTLEGSLHFFKEAAEMGKATLKKLVSSGAVFDESDYSVSTVKVARESANGTKVKVTGVVAQVNVNSSKAQVGFWLVDNTESIYVYDSSVASFVSVGNTVTICAEKTQFVASSEATNAAKWGYKGAIQLQNAHMTSNDKGNTEWDKSWVKESTVKKIMNTSYSSDITTTIFKTNALVKKSEGAGFVNYYIDDIDGHTGSYVYTMASGGDLNWLEEFDGKICTVYLSVINAKSTATGCNWRFYPVSVINENYKFDFTKSAEYATTYEVDNQFDDYYTADPAIEVKTSVSSELLGIEGVTVSYSSSNEDVVYFATEDDKLVMHTKDEGTADITVTATYGEYTSTIVETVTVGKPVEVNPVTVAQAIDTEVGEVIEVEGIVAGSYTNKEGFFIVDSTGTIAVLPTGGKTDITGLSVGNKVVVKGKRATYKKDETATGYVGQIQLESAEVVVNYFGKHEIPSDSFITDKTCSELMDIASAGATQQPKMYRIKCYPSLVETKYYTNFYLNPTATATNGLLCYSSSGTQHSWLYNTFSSDKEITVDLMLVNPNSKTNWRAMPLSATDGTTTVYNTLYLAA